MLNKLLLASSNQGKLTEFLTMSPSATLHASPLNLALLEDFAALPAFDESAPTFAENAAGKALHYSQFTDFPVLADDSGLVVPALNGAPGVRSARYAGPNATSAERNAKLLEEMKIFTGDQRQAHFVCAIAVAQKNRAIVIITAKSAGEILTAPRGTQGFGYDPIFYIKALAKSFAELTPTEKNQQSHRGKAFHKLALVVAGL